VLAAVYPLGVVSAILISLILGGQAGGSVVALALGLFAALLTAITLVILLTLDVDSRWPSLQDVIAEAYLIQWFLLAMTAVIMAAFVDDDKVKSITTIAIMLALVGGVLGSLSLYHLLRISTGEGRQHFLGGLLAAKLPVGEDGAHRQGVAGDAADSAELRSFLTRFQSSVDAGDVAALRERVSELTDAGLELHPPKLEAILALDLRVLRELGRALLLGRIDSPEIGATLFPRLGDLVVDHSSRLLDAGATTDASRENMGEIRAAAYLGQAARLFAWIGAAGYSDAVEKGYAPPGLCAAAAGSVAARDRILTAVDPESAHLTAAADRMPAGLSDPTACLMWWWAFCDLNGAHDGRSFYAALWMLTGEKFYGTFGWGNRFLLSELEDRLRDPGASAHEAQRVRAQEAIAGLGGLRGVALELLATSMAGWRDRRHTIPEGLEQNWTYWDDPRRLARRARLFLPRGGDPWLRDADDALHATARLLSRGSARSGVSELAKRGLDMLPIRTQPPVIGSSQRPAAVILAVGTHLAPRGDADDSLELERFLKRLPPSLLEASLSLAEAILHIDGSTSAHPAGEPVAAVIELLSFLEYDQQAPAH
jgi:hypothetical protein